MDMHVSLMMPKYVNEQRVNLLEGRNVSPYLHFYTRLMATVYKLYLMCFKRKITTDKVEQGLG